MARTWGRTAAVVVVLTCLVAPGAAVANHAGPLAGQWHLDGQSADGFHTPDSSGHGLDASTSTSPPPRYLPGRFGNAYTGAQSDGEAYNDIVVPRSALLEPQAVTLMAWVRRGSPPSPYAYVAAKGGDDCNGGASYALYSGPSGGLYFYIRGAVFGRTPDAGTGVWDGNWHFVVGAYDGATVRLYVDGAQVGAPVPAAGGINYSFAHGEFKIGSYPGSVADACNGYVASIDEVRVYDRALSASEIGRLAAATGPNPPDLVPDPGAGGGAGGGGGSALPPLSTPRFVAAKAVKLKRAVWLNGALSVVPPGVKIKRYDWDFNGDGKYEAGCGGDAPAVSTAFRKAANYSVTLRLTDVFERQSTIRQTVSVTKAEANLARGLFFDCEKPLGTNQPDRKDCVKTFSFGIVEVNGRGAGDQCFTLKSRPFTLSRSSGSARAAVPLESVNNIYEYHATIRGPVALNGLPIPLPKDVASEYDSGDNTIAFGKDVPIFLPLPGGKLIKITDIPLHQTITPSGHPPRFKLPPLKAPKIAKFGGLSLGGGLEISLLNRASEIKLSLKLPDVFSFGFRREAEGQVIVRATNQDGFSFEGARLAKIPQLFLGPLYVSDLFFDYHRTGDVWSGGASFQLAGISPVEIKASPPPPDYGFGLRGGQFEHAGGGVAFPIPPRPQLFPGIGLQEIGGSIGIKPYRFTGRMAIDVGAVIGIDGSAFVGLASQDQPYDFPEEFAPPGLEFLAGRRLDSVSVAVGGVGKLQAPVLGALPLLNAYVFYAYPDYAEFAGGFKHEFKFGGEKFSLEGGVGGFVAVGRRLFNLEGRVQGCIDIDVIGNVCKGIDAIVSSKGIGFCTVVPIPISPFGPVIPVDAGLGYTWGASFPDIMLFSCDAGPYREARPSSAGAAAGAARSFTLPAGLPSAMVKVTGVGGAPSVLLTGPKGERVLAPQTDQAAVASNVAVLSLADQSTTLIALKKPSGGRWTVTPQPGTTIRAVAARVGLAPPSIRARVSGRGRSRALTYAVRPDPGQTITFAERGARTWRLLGVVGKRRGRIPFTPADGRAGKRTIVALVERDGVTKYTIPVARYNAPGTPRPARPLRLRVGRRGDKLVVSWARARGAFRYAVTVELANGQRMLRVTRGARAVIGGIDPRIRATVRVGGLRRDNVAGAESVRRIAALRR